MKANSRRRVLISSVAMLLVAIVALGTSTYAWFSTKTTATAKGVNVKTTQASSLVLSLDQEEWKSEIDLGIANSDGTAKTLEPGSTADLSTWFAATSTGYDQGTVDKATIAGGVAGTNYAAKTFYIKSIGETLDVDWSIIFAQTQETTDKAYMRTAMTLTDTTTNNVFWWSDDGVTTDAISKNDGTTTSVSSSAAATGELATLTADKVYVLNIYVWFEGQDAQCIDSNAGTVCDFDVQFSKRA